jgi:adenosylhomocysteine nucleosidase
MTFELKSVAGKSILFVMAAEAEYGPFLRSRFEPLMTGVGPVEAAVALTRTLAALEHAGDLPQLVVSLGSAGSARLEQTEVIDLPLRIPGVAEASLSTGGNVVSGTAYSAIDADMVDMETFAILRACQAYTLPLIGLRGISDGVEELQHISGWTEYLHVIDRKLSDATDSLFTALEDGVFWF